MAIREQILLYHVQSPVMCRNRLAAAAFALSLPACLYTEPVECPSQYADTLPIIAHAPFFWTVCEARESSFAIYKASWGEYVQLDVAEDGSFFVEAQGVDAFGQTLDCEIVIRATSSP